MNPLLEFALSNFLVASVLAVFAYAAGCWGRRPALTHGMWLLVLLKLLTPPLFRVPVGDWLPRQPEQIAQAPVLIEPPPAPVVEEPLPFPEEIIAEGDLWLDEMVPWDEPIEAALVPAAVPLAPPADPAVVAAALRWDAQTCLVVVWGAGSLLWIAIAVSRIWRFRRLLRFAEPASPEVTELAETLADRLHVDCPEVRVVPGVVSPLLWVVGRSAQLIIPKGLLARLSPEQQATLLTHELAHWTRRDHWVRWLEMAALAAYWWCPLVWWAKRSMQQAEEECCDAWVVSVLPGHARAYALALVETVDFLAGAPAMLPPAASGIGHVRSLQRRLTMILRGQTPRALTSAGLLGLAGVGLLILPLVPNWSASTAQDAPRKERPAAKDNQREGDRNENQQKKGRDGDGGRKEQAGGDDLRRMQAELEQARTRLEAMRANLERREQELRNMMENMRNQGPGKKDGPRNPGPQPGAGGAGGPGGGQPGQPGQPPGWIGKGPGMPGMPGMGGMGGGMMMGGPNLERRLNEMDRKIEMLLQEMQKMQQELRGRGPGGPAGESRPLPRREGDAPPGAGRGGDRSDPLGPPPVRRQNSGTPAPRSSDGR